MSEKCNIRPIPLVKFSIYETFITLENYLWIKLSFLHCKNSWVSRWPPRNDKKKSKSNDNIWFKVGCRCPSECLLRWGAGPKVGVLGLRDLKKALAVRIKGLTYEISELQKNALTIQKNRQKKCRCPKRPSAMNLWEPLSQRFPNLPDYWIHWGRESGWCLGTGILTSSPSASDNRPDLRSTGL